MPSRVEKDVGYLLKVTWPTFHSFHFEISTSLFLIMCDCVCMFVCSCLSCMYRCSGSQSRVLHPLKLELEVVSGPTLEVGTGNRIQVL